MSEKSPIYKIKVDGSIEALPDRHPTLKEMQEAVGGLVEPVRLTEGRLMVADEEGRLKGKPLNQTATLLARRTIVGDVLVMPEEYFD